MFLAWRNGIHDDVAAPVAHGTSREALWRIYTAQTR
jgi:hypothetical protein